MTDAANRAARQAAVEFLFAPGEEFGERCRIETVAHGKIRIAELCKIVPRATELAVVAAIDAIADQWPQFGRDGSRQLDGQLGNAQAGIDLIGRDDGGGRAGVEAAPAGSAVLADRRVRRQGQVGVDFAEKVP